MVRDLRDHLGNAVLKYIGAIASLKTVHQISGGSSHETIQQFWTTGIMKFFYRPLNSDANKQFEDLASVYFQVPSELNIELN
jgi:hypothetical protein